MIKQSYQEVDKRFEIVREIGREVVDDPHANRCAMAVSGALRLKPKHGDLNFSASPDLKNQYKGQEFLKRYFLKARAAADAIKQTQGVPDLVLTEGLFNKLKTQPPGV